MAGFDRQDAAGCRQELGVVGKEGTSAQVGSDTHRCNHVGQVDERDRVGVGELVRAGRDGGLAGIGENGADGVGVGLLMLFDGQSRRCGSFRVERYSHRQ